MNLTINSLVLKRWIMIKTKHPSNRAERIKIKKKKDLHDNASPVYKLLKERDINLAVEPKGKNNDL